MSYISAMTRGDEVILWERTVHGREEVRVRAPFYFYVADPHGKYTTIYGDKVTRLEFANSKEFNKKKAECEGSRTKMYESDISPDLRVLSHVYRNEPAPPLHVTFYDIEVDYDPAIGFSSTINPYAPVNAVALLHHWCNKMVVLAVPPEAGWTEERLWDELNKFQDSAPIPEKYTVDLILCEDERELLLRFLELIHDSDVICGWNSDMFDTPYMAKRIEMTLGKRFVDRLDFDGVGTPRTKDVLNKDKSKVIGQEVMLRGRIATDYMRLYKKYEPGEKASFKLSAIEQEVGLNLPKLEYSGTLHGLYRDNFAYFMRYNIRDTEILGGFEDKLGYVELANQMYHISCGLFTHVLGTIKLAELAIVNYCHHELKQVVPDFALSETDRSIEGALVLLPQVGEHHMTASIDINSLYPSSIRSINISPETLIGQFTCTDEATLEMYRQSDKLLTLELDRSGDTVNMTAKEWREELKARKWAVSGYGTVFDQSVPGIIPTILADWYAQRKRYQALKRDAADNSDDDQADYYDRLQYVYKIKLNSLYGALTNLYFRFFDLRMGESTTATGRAILKHQCRKVSELLGDGYDVDFPLYLNAKEAIESGRGIDTALMGPVFNGAHQSACVIYGDTDSTYFKTYANDLDEAILIADTVADGVNKSYPEFMREMFLCNPGFDDIIKAGREIVSDAGIFVDKKRYILHVADNEGTRVDKMKVMGLDTKKTTLPKHVADKLNGFIEMYLKGTDWKQLSEMIVEYKERLLRSDNVLDIGLPKGVNGVDEYTLAYETQGDKARLPGHVAASIFYNKMLKQYDDKVSPEIISGTKIKVFYLMSQYGKFKSIALPTDIERVPQWFLDNFKIKYDAHIERLVDNPLENILKAIGKRSPSKQDLIVDSFFEF